MNLFIGALLAVVSFASATHVFTIHNRCSYEVWIGFLNNPGKSLPMNGGFRMGAGSNKDVYIDDYWAGRLWGRTHCDGSNHCQTGDCGNRLQCSGAGGVPPVTLAEFTLQGHAGLDYYDVSLVDGYNLQVRITPKAGSFVHGSGTYYCKEAGCYSDMNRSCPPGQQIHQHGTNTVIACKSACLAYNTDRYCCRGAHNRPSTCPPFHESQLFKAACPKAYSYAYDDGKSTYTCRGQPHANYDITFC